jgi:hypothetical protein
MWLWLGRNNTITNIQPPCMHTGIRYTGIRYTVAMLHRRFIRTGNAPKMDQYLSTTKLTKMARLPQDVSYCLGTAI